MFRVSDYLRTLHFDAPVAVARSPKAPVVIWNLVRRCNLTCRHCYSISADVDFPGELSTEQAIAVIDDLHAFGVPALILSGGEPLLRHDIFELAQYAKSKNLYLGLSSNGTLIDELMVQDIADVGFDYLGISIDGMREAHDSFRRRKGAFDASLRGVELCQQAGIKVGLRYTPTLDNKDDFEPLLDLVQQRGIDKFYLSHLNYSGRGRINRRRDAYHLHSRQIMDILFERALEAIRCGHPIDFVTGNNDADGPYLLLWAAHRFPALRVERLAQRLLDWGGNSSGVNIANIDNLGQVHPDTFWWDHTIGNVKDTPFSQIWRTTQDPLMLGLRQRPRPVEGRCAACQYLDMCNGNTRVRARSTTGNAWAEDPGCYLSDEEIGLTEVNRHIACAMV
jgi:heme d1 biosynthesis radical SAM protein NirJ